jgi:hypothetical protein
MMHAGVKSEEDLLEVYAEQGVCHMYSVCNPPAQTEWIAWSVTTLAPVMHALDIHDTGQLICCYAVC